MQYRSLGRSGLKVSPWCLGTMTFGDSQWKLGGVDQKTATTMVAMALDHGINFFDTADVYSHGAAETMLGKALSSRRAEAVVATKALGAMGPGPNDRGLSRKHLEDALVQSLGRLHTDYIDLYQVHGVDASTPLEETLETLSRFVTQGKVRYIGLSNYPAWQIVKAGLLSATHGYAPFISAQMHYSLVNRDIEYEVVPACLDQGLGIMVWSPLSGGYLSGKYKSAKAPPGTRFGDRDLWFPPFDRALGQRVLAPLEKAAQDHRTTMPAVALAWLKDRPGVTSVLIGARSLDQLKANLEALDLELDPASRAELDQVSAPPPMYPGWMIATQGGR